MIFNEVPVGSECFELDHLGEEIKYRKENTLGISGMACNAVRLTDGVNCYVPLDKEVILVEAQS